MQTPRRKHSDHLSPSEARLPTALETATFAVTLLEDNPLFNSAHGSVFTRDGINELEASVMVSRGRAKRCAAVSLVRRVRNPILLARAMLERGEADLGGKNGEHRGPLAAGSDSDAAESGLDVPSAQGHTIVSGPAAEALARKYGLELVDPGYFFTKARWDEHRRALQREKEGKGLSTWSAEEFLPQGTCGAVALDEGGVLCCATSTGGMTNKLGGRIGDTPVPGAGFWAEEWHEEGDPTAGGPGGQAYFAPNSPVVAVSEGLRGLLGDCLPSPFVYAPFPSQVRRGLSTTRSFAASGTGNGDSFLRISAVRTVAAMARFQPLSSAIAVGRVAGPTGELQRSAQDRWGKTGEGEGGMIGIECAVVRGHDGSVAETRGEIVQDYNCAGMFRAWIDDDGAAVVRIWRDDAEL